MAIHFEVRERAERTFRDELRSAGHGAFRTECRVVGVTDGVERWMSVQGRCIKDPAHRPIRLIGTAFDIGDLRRVYLELLFRKTLLGPQSETAIDGILVVDPAGRMIFFNHRVSMWGNPPDVIASRSDEAALASVLHKLADPDWFLIRVRFLYDHPEE